MPPCIFARMLPVRAEAGGGAADSSPARSRSFSKKPPLKKALPSSRRRSGAQEEPSEMYSRLMDVSGDAHEDEPEVDAVVRVFSTHSTPDYRLPWQRRRQFSTTSSGFLIAGNRVLTNAHSVEHATTVAVQRRGEERRFLARVLAVGTECDLAILSVEDADFWAAAPPPLSFGKLPRLNDTVTVVGFPIGGDTVSITSGVVSRVEVLPYTHGASQLLCLQTDAAINAGNSGGPCLNESGQVVGVAFQSLCGDDVDGVGFVIPTPIIAHLLADLERNPGTPPGGFPTAGFEWQPAKAPALRASLGLTEEDVNRPKGVLVTRIEPTSCFASALAAGDVLLSVDGKPIGCDGTVAFRPGERIAFEHLITQRFVGEVAKLTFQRAGALRSAEVTLGRHTWLVPPFTEQSIPGMPDTPSYIVVGGCVFVAATEPYLKAAFGDDYEYESPPQLLLALLEEQATDAQEQCVVLSCLLASPLTVGWDEDELANERLRSLNGKPIRSLRGLATALAELPEGTRWLSFSFEGGRCLVLDAVESRAQAAAIAKTHSVPAQASADLLPLLPAC
jgi:S1-C subfamily serine protease